MPRQQEARLLRQKRAKNAAYQKSPSGRAAHNHAARKWAAAKRLRQRLIGFFPMGLPMITAAEQLDVCVSEQRENDN